MATQPQQQEHPREQKLRDFLNEINAQSMWQQRVPRVGMIECWVANGRILLVQHYEKSDGWDIYLSASTSNHIPTTFDAVRKHLKAAK